MKSIPTHVLVFAFALIALQMSGKGPDFGSKSNGEKKPNPESKSETRTKTDTVTGGESTPNVVPKPSTKRIERRPIGYERASTSLNVVHALNQLQFVKKEYPNCEKLRVAEFMRQMEGVYYAVKETGSIKRYHGVDVLFLFLRPIGPEPKRMVITDSASKLLNLVRLIDTVIVNVHEIRPAITCYDNTSCPELKGLRSTTELEVIGVSRSEGIVYTRRQYIHADVKESTLSYVLGHMGLMHPFNNGEYVTPVFE